MLFLWGASYKETSSEVKLSFLDTDKERIIDFSVNSYLPYFLAPYPLSRQETEAVESFQGQVETVKKRNLFTGKVSSMAKVKVRTPALLRSLLRKFRQAWENEIDYSRSFIYDNGLVFGAPYIRQGELFQINVDIEDGLKQRFKDTFGVEDMRGSPKHRQIEKWFRLLNLKLPEISVGLFSLSGKKDLMDFYPTLLLSRLTNSPVEEVASNRRVSVWIRSIIHNYMRNRNILIPTSEELRKGFKIRKIPGALTIKPVAGIYFNTVVCDFESLYPSCIDTYNLSYETVNCLHEECKINKVQETDHYVCTRRRGIYSILIGALKDLRIRWFKPLSKSTLSREIRNQARAASAMLKLLSVSAYGVTIRIHGLACPPLAESITSYGRRALRETFSIAEENGLHPLYGDTDSIFLDNPSLSQVHNLVTRVKDQLELELAVQRHYSICVLPKARKAYFGITKEGKTDLKGLTAIKSNAPRFIQQVFRQCVRTLRGVEDPQQYELAKRRIAEIVHQQTKRLLQGKVSLEELIYSVKLYHNPRERVQVSRIVSQPYQCAMQLIEEGEKLKRGDIVRFLKVRPFNYRGKIFTVKPFRKVRSLSEVNMEDYIRNLTTALNQTFEPMNIEWNVDPSLKLTKWFDH